MGARKLALQCLSSMCIILACGKAGTAQVHPPQYGFIEVTSESGSPVPEAVVVIYNGSGEEIHRQITDRDGKLFVWGGIKNEIVLEQQRSLKNGANCVIRVIKSGYLVYEDAIEGDLTRDGAFVSDRGKERGAVGFKIMLLRPPKSKVSNARERPPESQAQNRPP